MRRKRRCERWRRWTGGDLFVTSAPAHESIAARQIVDELRHQYVLGVQRVGLAGVAPARRQTKDRDFTVRAQVGLQRRAPGSWIVSGRYGPKESGDEEDSS